MRRLVLAAFAVALVCAPADAATRSHPLCAPKALAATFAKIPGSAGGGLVSYRLTMTNRGGATCLLFGLPRLTLLDARGHILPTRAGPIDVSALGRKTVLKPGATASLAARFSPNYAAPVDDQSGSCQPVAARLRIEPGYQGTSAALITQVDPPTSVCNRGSIQLGGWKT